MADKDKDKNNPNLGCLEEDDEFEEFPVEGKKIFMFLVQVIFSSCNWRFGKEICSHFSK